MKSFFLILLISIALLSCEKPKDVTGPNYNALVLAGSANCTGAYILKFDPDVTGLHNNFQNNSYVEINLDEKYKVAGKFLMVSFRRPTAEEIIECDESILVYPQMYIIDAHD